MTDKDIIKALECCDDFGWCGQCSLQGVIDCKTVLTDNALDLINRQQSAIDVYMQENDRLKTAYIQVSMDRDEAKAEIEKLQLSRKQKLKEIERLKRGWKADVIETENIKAEAIKELEAKIYEKLHEAEMHGNFEPTLTREMLDSIFKEMVGEGK
jgi:putative protein kinase ArgK-like GTPase of G3E family